MGIAEILGVAGSLSLLAGWRLYLTIFATGIAMHFGWLPLPEHLKALQILANPWVLGVATVGTLAEFFADKVAWIDSAWDTIHSVIRPLGGALPVTAAARHPPAMAPRHHCRRPTGSEPGLPGGRGAAATIARRRHSPDE